MKTIDFREPTEFPEDEPRTRACTRGRQLWVRNLILVCHEFRNMECHKTTTIKEKKKMKKKKREKISSGKES